MEFQVTDTVKTVRQIRAGRLEDGPVICEKNMCGRVVEIEKGEWDGVHVRLDNNVLWWFRPSQLCSYED